MAEVFSKTELEKRGIFRRYWNCTFAEMEKRGIPVQARMNYSEIKRYADNLSENVKAGIGLILKGPAGTMKTSLAIAILQQHITPRWLRIIRANGKHVRQPFHHERAEPRRMDCL
ncbi:MAG: hypothetical protein ABFC57_08660 [Veillonellales bacterium]